MRRCIGNGGQREFFGLGWARVHAQADSPAQKLDLGKATLASQPLAVLTALLSCAAERTGPRSLCDATGRVVT